MMKFGVIIAVLCIAASLYEVDAIKCWSCDSSKQAWCTEPETFNETMKNDKNKVEECSTFTSRAVCIKVKTTVGGHVTLQRNCTMEEFVDINCLSIKDLGIKVECNTCYSDFCNAAPNGFVAGGALIISMLMLIKIIPF